MNKVRRKALRDIADELETLKCTLEELRAEEEDYRYNMPENLQGSERYEMAENAISNLDDAICYLEDAICGVEAAAE